MTDPRTEAARIGFWDEGIGAWGQAVPPVDWARFDRWLNSDEEEA